MRKMKESGIQWIGKIPVDWEIIRCKNISSFINGFAFNSSDFSFDCKYPVIRIGDIQNGTINLEGCVGVNYNETLEPYKIEKNDLLLAMSGATVGKVGIVNFDDIAYVNQRVGIIRTDIPRYMFYSISTHEFIKYILLMNNSSAQPNISGYIYGNYPITIPNNSKEIQKIEVYLDEKCEKIDAIIEKQQTIIAKLKEYKSSVITEAITKGSKHDVEMKDSGSIWFGKIPAHWEMKRLKYVFHIQKDIAGEEGHTVLSITQRGIVPKDFSNNEGQFANSYTHYQLVHIGDFAMNHMDLLTGWVDISRYEGVTSPDYRVFVLNDKENNCPEYFLYMMQMCYTQKIFYGLGAGVSGLGRWRLQAEKFLNFWIPIPPKEEQEMIAKDISYKLDKIEKNILRRENIIHKLTEYKKSLIYEVVTGKKEV